MSQNPIPTNREYWLNAAVDVLRDAIFKPHGITIPALRLSVGLPHARNQRDVLVQHHAAAHTADNVAQVFVSPLMSEGPAVLAQLHNCLHKVYGAHRIHDRPPFGRKHVDLIMDTLGPYPQSALTLPEARKQDTRMIKMTCKSCGYTCRATHRWIDKYGAPYCACRPKDSGTRMTVHA